MAKIQRIAPCLWFDGQAEEAARFYAGIFPNSRVVSVSRYGKAGYEIHRRPAGSVMTVAFELDARAFTALNGGPLFRFAGSRTATASPGRSCRRCCRASWRGRRPTG